MSQTVSPLKGRSELGMALLLGAVGIIVIWDATTLKVAYSNSDPVGPKTLPYIVGGLLLVCAALLAREVMKGGHGEVEGGEDIDLSHGTDWRTVVPLVAAFIANILLIDILGWVVSGAILYWGSVWALGSRHYVRDAIVSVVLSLITFYGFYLGLGIKLPAGVLDGVL
ncbi:putative tricarboxylic transport membrane protein [Arthrobacter sp. UYP6]|uniref:tripartite tricarboxylate transporter TctB family protein n=1 Tax=Arthrobacter sp. UYP6 TaxID=1756378 RepID=UPI0033962990